MNIKIREVSEKIKSYSFLAFIFLTSITFSFAQSARTDTLRFNRKQYEELFLKQNLFLIAEKLNINQADAILLQAKLWPNPSITIDDVNLWTTKHQLANLDSPLPPVFGNIAKNTQLSVQIEQLIQTVGKRKKLMAMEKVSVDLAKQQFEDVLRNLKFEFRNNLTQLHYLQQYIKVFMQQQSSVDKLLVNYQKQVENNIISKGEFVRLKVLQLELSKELNDLNKQANEVQADLQVMMNLPSDLSLDVNEEDFSYDLDKVKEIHLDRLYAQALDHRPDVKIAGLENTHYSKLLNYEKSQRVPNLNIMGRYDRGGGIWPSFIGFGIAIDIPVFDRNQGNISYAKIGMEQTKILMEEKQLKVKAEVSQNYKDLLSAIALYESIDPLYEQDLDTLLNSYTKNFANRNISLLEYLDFQEAYLENKKIILRSQKDIHLHLEELQYIIGKEIN